MTATVERPAPTPQDPGAGRYRLQLGPGLVAHTDWDSDGTTTITIRHRPTTDEDDNRPF